MKYGLGQPICRHCNLPRTAEGHDACVGTLPGVANACCGHGETQMAYVQFRHANYENDPNGKRLSGQSALDFIAAANVK
jgi:hypothetical protein